MICEKIYLAFEFILRIFKPRSSDSQAMADDEEARLMEGEDNSEIQKIWDKIPPEMWVKILSEDHSPAQPRYSAERRFVCKMWRGVTDDHLDFRIIVDDSELDLTDLGHLRGTHCIIRHLLSNEMPDPLFKGPERLHELWVWGPITPRNFQGLMRMFPNIVKLSLNERSLFHANLVRLNPHDNVNNYWTQLKSLRIDVSHPVSPESIGSIFDLPVSSVESFIFLVTNITPTYNDIFSNVEMLVFISRMRNLKKLHLKAHKIFRREDLNPRPGPPVPNPVVTHNIEGIQLDSVRLTLSSRALCTLMPFLRTQNRLQLIQIVDKFTLPLPANDINVYIMDALGDTLTLNRNTLTCIEFSNIRLSQSIDCLVFEHMNQLKRLVLRRYPTPTNDPQIANVLPPHIRNLQWLPCASLEYVTLDFLCCNSIDLELMADRMVNIKRLQLKNVGVTGEDQAGHLFGVNQQVLQKIAMKRNIERVLVDPLDTDRFHIVVNVNNNLSYVAVNGLFIEVLRKDNGSSYIEYDFTNARNQL